MFKKFILNSRDVQRALFRDFRSEIQWNGKSSGINFRKFRNSVPSWMEYPESSKRASSICDKCQMFWSSCRTWAHVDTWENRNGGRSTPSISVLSLWIFVPRFGSFPSASMQFFCFNQQRYVTAVVMLSYLTRSTLTLFLATTTRMFL